MGLFSEKREFPISGHRKLIWIWDEKESNAALTKSNNLSVYDASGTEIWNMRSVVKHDDTCVGVTVREHEFYFVTFNGLGVTMDIETLTVIQTQITK